MAGAADVPGRQIEADVSGLSATRACSADPWPGGVAITPGKVRRVRLLPTDRRRPGGLSARHHGCQIWWSWGPVVVRSVIPHVLVPKVWPQRCEQRRPAVPWCSTWWLNRETAGFSVERHLHASNTPGFTVHDIIIDAERVPRRTGQNNCAARRRCRASPAR